MIHRAKDIAGFIVDYALKNNKPITNLQLQKLLYYVEAMSLAKRGESVIDDNIEKWKLGPVIPDVYHNYKGFGKSPISSIPKELIIKEDDPFAIEYKEFDSNSVNATDAEEIIIPVINKLIDYSGFRLVDMTHEHTPWINDLPRINKGEKGITYNKGELMDYFRNHPDMQVI